MKRLTLTLTLVFIVAACGDDDTGDTSVTSGAAVTAATEATATTATPATSTTTAAATTTTTAAAPATTGATASTAGPDFQITSVAFGSPMVVIHNVGTESGTSVNALADVLEGIAGSSPGRDHQPARAGELLRSTLDTSRLRSAGWSPGWTLEDGLRETYEFIAGSRMSG